MFYKYTQSYGLNLFGVILFQDVKLILWVIYSYMYIYGFTTWKIQAVKHKNVEIRFK